MFVLKPWSLMLYLSMCRYIDIITSPCYSTIRHRPPILQAIGHDTGLLSSSYCQPPCEEHRFSSTRSRLPTVIFIRKIVKMKIGYQGCLKRLRIWNMWNCLHKSINSTVSGKKWTPREQTTVSFHVNGSEIMISEYQRVKILNHATVEPSVRETNTCGPVFHSRGLLP